MAMAAWLQLVTDKEIAALRKMPTKINKLNNEGFNTYWYCTINYFLCGDAYPSPVKKKPLTAMLFGYESIQTSTLECGNFGLIMPSSVKAIANALENVDLAKLKKQVENADPEELAEEEVDDFELLAEGDDAGMTVVEDVKGLRKFYSKAAKLGRGVVMYTT